MKAQPGSSIVTLIIGWLGSTEGQLAQYAALHQEGGHRTHLVRYSSFDGLFRLDRLYEACAAQVPELAAVAGNSDLMIHLFSDGGFTYLCILLQVLRKTAQGRRLAGRIRAIIFDSAPGLYAAGRAEYSRRFAYIMTRALLRQRQPGTHSCHSIVMPLFERCLDLYQLVWSDTVHRIQHAFDAVSADYPDCPHLLLYGSRDPITPAADVENFVATLRSRRVPVQTVRFDTDVHLGCYRSAQGTYRRAVAAHTSCKRPRHLTLKDLWE